MTIVRMPFGCTLLALLALLLVPHASRAQIPIDNDAVQIRSSADRGSTRVLLENLPPSTDLRAISIARGTWQRTERIVGPVAGNGFPSTHYHAEQFTFADDSREIIAHFRARAADSSPVAVRIVDQDGRVHCVASGAGNTGATCTARVPSREFSGRTIHGRFMLLVQAEQRGLRNTTVTVEGFFHWGLPETSDLELQVDPIVRNDGTALMTLPINMRVHAPGRVLAQLIELRDGDRPLRRFVARSEWDGSAPAASIGLFQDGRLLGPTGILRASSMHAGISTHRRLPFLVPANVDSVEISIATYESTDGVVHPHGTPRDLVLELHHLDGDPAQARVDAVLPGRRPDIVVDAETERAAPTPSTERITLRGAALKPGRWFAVPVSKTGIPVNVRLDVHFPEGRALEPAVGHYFNPARPGHGLYLAEAGSDWVLIWFTYDNAGRPVWYYAQGPQPSAQSGGSQWHATLYRTVWNGSRTRFQFVGFVQLAMTGEGRMAFAHLVNGTLGIETMQRLGVGGCSQRRAGRPVDVNGLWYSPEKPGYGFSVELIGDTEFLLAYAYDGLGRPIWATAQQRFDDATRVPLVQVRGFCPTCGMVPVTRTEIGWLERHMVDTAIPDGLPGYGALGIDASWSDGIPGVWREFRPAALLSARAGCR